MKLRQMCKMGVATVASRLGGSAIPLNVMISVTNRCPARCRYCGIPDRRQRELTTAELLGLLDQLRAAGTQRIALWGGEPLVRDDIGVVLEHARRCGFFISLDTNGYLVPDKLAELAPVDVLVVSLDGPREVHDRNREPGSHDRAMRALELASRRMTVFTITVLTRENLGSIDFVLEAARRHGFATTFQLLHHTEGLASRGEGGLLPGDEDYRRAIRHLLDRKRAGAPIVSSVQYLEYLLEWPDYSRCTSPVQGRLACQAGTLYCNVDTDGSVYPCSGLVGRVPARSFLEVGFAEAFAAADRGECRACIASCFTEYNFMHALNPAVILNWARYTRPRTARAGTPVHGP